MARAVDEDAEIQLTSDVKPLLDEHTGHLPALGPGLMGHQVHAEHLSGQLLGFVRRPRELDATSLAAATRVDLRLHDNDLRAETPSDLARFRGRERDLALRNRHTEPREHSFGLVFVDFQ